MTPASFFTGAPPGSSGQIKRNRKAPSVAGGAQKIPVRGIVSARETSLVHPLKVDSKLIQVDCIVTVRLKPRMTILRKILRGAAAFERARRLYPALPPATQHIQTERLVCEPFHYSGKRSNFTVCPVSDVMFAAIGRVTQSRHRGDPPPGAKNRRFDRAQ
jgi:hypothetical protein